MSACGSPLSSNRRIEPAVAVKLRVRLGGGRWIAACVATPRSSLLARWRRPGRRCRRGLRLRGWLFRDVGFLGARGRREAQHQKDASEAHGPPRRETKSHVVCSLRARPTLQAPRVPAQKCNSRCGTQRQEIGGNHIPDSAGACDRAPRSEPPRLLIVLGDTEVISVTSADGSVRYFEVFTKPKGAGAD